MGVDHGGSRVILVGYTSVIKNWSITNITASNMTRRKLLYVRNVHIQMESVVNIERYTKLDDWLVGGA